MNDVKAIRCTFPQRLKPQTVRSDGGMAEESAEKVAFVTSGAEARIQMKELIAALEALRHPKSEFFRSL